MTGATISEVAAKAVLEATAVKEDSRGVKAVSEEIVAKEVFNVVKAASEVTVAREVFNAVKVASSAAKEDSASPALEADPPAVFPAEAEDVNHLLVPV